MEVSVRGSAWGVGCEGMGSWCRGVGLCGLGDKSEAWLWALALH